MTFVRWLRAVPVGLVLFVLLLVTNALMVLSWPGKFFWPKAIFKFNRTVAKTWWALGVWVQRHLYGIQIQTEGDALPINESAIVIINHQTMADVPVLLELAHRQNRLGDIKCFVKDSLKWVPGMGWGMKLLGFPYVKRNWLKDQNSIQRTFATITTLEMPIWMLNFAEGTRSTPQKIARSQAYAQKHELPILNHLMLPRTKGFIASLRGLHSRIDAVYLITLFFPSKTPSLGQWFLGTCPKVLVRTRRFEKASLPQDDEALEQWLIQEFIAKDQWLAVQHQRHTTKM